MRGRADILSLFFSPHVRARELARSSQHRAKSQTSNVPRNPHILTRDRSTAELRVVDIEAKRTESLAEEPSPESNDLAMSRLLTRATINSPGVSLAPSLKVCTCTRKKKELVLYGCNSPWVRGAHWVHTLGHLESTNLPTSVAARIVSNFS